MIDLERETLLTLGQAARLVPARRGGRGDKGSGTHPTTLWRWATKGKLGIRLETVDCPNGDLLTTAAALGRFLAALKTAKAREPVAPRPAAGEAARERWAASVLDRAGI